MENLNIKETLLRFMDEEAYKPMTLKELAYLFSIKKTDLKDFDRVLKTMENEGLIVKTRTNTYGIPEKLGLIVGDLIGNQKGFGFVRPHQDIPDIYIPLEGINGAMNGDKVMVKITSEKREGRKCEGEIIRIIERANNTVIGVFEDSKHFGFVVPSDKRISQDIFVPKNLKSTAKNGDVVVAEITVWPEQRRNPEGKIIEILGNQYEKGVDIRTIMKKYHLPEEFPVDVQDFADRVPEEITEKEYEGRLDLRTLKIVTIDGADAKDLDDAVSIEKLPNGNYKLGVHIADVTHYVKDKNPLDKEAFKRGTSVYLVDRVVPMLPKKLSNGVCSLNPKVDRLTLSCIMEINKDGKVIDHDIRETIIKTSERMTYDDVTAILTDNDQKLIHRYNYLLPEFKLMEELFKILYKKRINRGAIDFDFDEAKIILDEEGNVAEVKPYERAVSNRIIEEFMLVCNETVAEHMFWANMPFVYRIHEEPDQEKLMHFNEFIHNLGYFIRIGTEVHPGMLQDIVDKVKGKKEETVVNTLLLRSLRQARYSPSSTGHFGLAARYYCHFTSPIRRYPDLMIHRIIKDFIKGNIDEKRYKYYTKAVEDASIQSSLTERNAVDAEREVDALMFAKYMENKIGQQFEGIISSVTNFGLFVELPSTIEGLIHMSQLLDDFYVYDEAHLCLIGQRYKKIYRLGDEIKVEVTEVNIDSHEIFFKIADEHNNEINEDEKDEPVETNHKKAKEAKEEEIEIDNDKIIEEILSYDPVVKPKKPATRKRPRSNTSKPQKKNVSKSKKITKTK